MKILLAALFLLVSSEARASWWAPVQVSNNPGDTIYGQIRITRFGDDGFHADNYSSSGDQFVFYGPAAWDGGNNLLEFYIVATQPNLYLYNQICCGSTSGWRSQLEILEVRAPQPRYDLVALSPEERDRTKEWSKRLSRGIVYMDSLTLVQSILCGASSDNDACYWARLYVQITIGLRIARAWVDMTDPFDAQFAEPYEPSFPDLGLSCEDDFSCWMNERLGNIAQMWDGIYTSVNRAQSCADMGREDCFRWQRERIESFLWAGGAHTESVAYGMSTVADRIIAEASGRARAVAEELYAIASEMKGACAWC